jgi:Flp pilus assembly protein TadD
LPAGFLIRRTNGDRATAQFRVALEEKPNDVRLLEGLAAVLEGTGDNDEACKVYQRITRLEPQRPGIHSKWADVVDRLERRDEAIENLRRRRTVKPSDASLANNLAWRLATSPQPDLRNGPEAVQLAELANELFPDRHFLLLNTLGASYAAVGRFPDAIAASEEALALARKANDEAAIARTLDFLKQFKRGATIVDRTERDRGEQEQDDGK